MGGLTAIKRLRHTRQASGYMWLQRAGSYSFSKHDGCWINHPVILNLFQDLKRCVWNIYPVSTIGLVLLLFYCNIRKSYIDCITEIRVCRDSARMRREGHYISSSTYGVICS